MIGLGREWIWRLAFALLSAPVFPVVVFAGPAIRNLELTPPSEVPRHGKFEITFEIDTAAENPYFPYDSSPPAGVQPEAGISVDAQFTHDDWLTIYTVPGFYYQEFLHEIRGAREWLYPTERYYWKVRFSPPWEGAWQLRIIARDKSGVSLSPVGSFNVLPSEDRGFLRVSRKDSRYFEYGDGTYFPALGFNMNFDQVSWRNPILDNLESFRVMQQHGIQLVRMWLSQWSICGSEWNPWSAPDPALHSEYLPHTGIAFEEAALGSEASMKLQADQSPCMFIGAWKAPPAMKRNTDYRVRARVLTRGVSGPRVSGQPYGFVAKTGGWLWEDGDRCNDPGTGLVVTPYQAEDTPDWHILEGALNSGPHDFLPNFFLVLENVNTGAAFVDRVWIEEKLGSGGFGPNIVSKPWMAHHLYFEQRNSYAFDKVLELAAAHDIYLRVVLHEKKDRLLSAFDYSGNPVVPGEHWFYGNYGEITKVRWLLQAFWRYAQARWGYSPHIHSWELLNEGDPWNDRHYALAEEFGKYLHCRVFGGTPGVSGGDRCSAETPNVHMVSTSFWHGFPRDEFWANSAYSSMDFADLHEYIPEDRSAEYSDTALATMSVSSQFGAKQAEGSGKPLIRGEVGFVIPGSDLPSEKLLRDVRGVWLHNFVWGGINPGGMIESYWFAGTHIYNADAGFDHRGSFGNFHSFIRDIPLNNGQYRDAQAQVTNPRFRAWGQKDLTNGRAHLWIQNQSHTWENVVDGRTVEPESGAVILTGFQLGRLYRIEWWDTYVADPAKRVFSTDFVRGGLNGAITLAVDGLVSDIAVKIFAADEAKLRPPSPPVRQPRGAGRLR